LHLVGHCELLYWLLVKKEVESRWSEEKGVVDGKKVEMVVD
jgi:hypothetical protein